MSPRGLRWEWRSELMSESVQANEWVNEWLVGLLAKWLAACFWLSHYKSWYPTFFFLQDGCLEIRGGIVFGWIDWLVVWLVTCLSRLTWPVRFLLMTGPRGLTFTWWGCCSLCLWPKPNERAHSFLVCSCVCLCLYGPFNCISFYKFSRQLSAFSLGSSGLIPALLVLSTRHLFTRFMPPPPRDFRGRKGAWLSSRQNSAKRSGGPNKAGYEKFIHLVSPTESSMMQPISDYDIHMRGAAAVSFSPEIIIPGGWPGSKHKLTVTN